MYKKWRKKRQGRNKENHKNRDSEHTPIDLHLQDFKDKIQQTFVNSADLFIEEMKVVDQRGLLIYLSTMTDSVVVTEKVVNPLLSIEEKQATVYSQEDWEEIGHELFSGTQHTFIECEKEVVTSILQGYAILYLEGMTRVLSLRVHHVEYRSLEEPSTQTVVRGPKDGFTENLDTNLSLIRRRIKNSSLCFEAHTLGSETATNVHIAYLDGVANKKIVEEVRSRLMSIKTHAVFESSNIEEFIVDKTFTPFPLIYNTERPDCVSAHLIEGKVAIFIDGSPFVLTMPSTFAEFLSSTEDYYQPFMMGSFIRLIRYLSFLVTLLFPAVYVAIITFHHDMIPTTLLISVMAQREAVPFPAVVEALIMEITFEILREAGVRMPRAVGGTISIVGGLVIGQAAVEAGVVSQFMVIVVALTAMASFVTPVHTFAIASRLLRFIYIILGGALGLYGILLGLIILVGHLTSLRSFGIPYMVPFAPFVLSEHKDVWVRFPMWAMKKRAPSLKTEAPFLQPHAEPPEPPPPRRRRRR